MPRLFEEPALTENQHIKRLGDQLSAALDKGQVPSQHIELAQQLTSHLRKPVNVVIMGPKGCGKSTLLNMILAQKIVPGSKDIPIVEITHGAGECVSFERRDGTSTWQQGRLCDCVVPDEVVRARQELNSPALDGQNYFEISLGSHDHAASVLSLVSELADIVLWCTQEFSAEERRLWQAVPDALKDRSCLVLTKADQLLSLGTFETKTTELSSIVAEEFLGLFPVASRQALKARTDDTGMSRSHWSSSGGQRLVETLTRLIDQGRSEVLDHAQMLIDAYAHPALPLEKVKPSSTAQQQDGKPPKTENAPALIGAPDNTGIDTVEEYDRALAILETGAEELLDLASAPDLDNEQVISVCTKTLTRLSDHLSSLPRGTTHLNEAFRDVQEGQEMVLTCELEGCDDAATDAVTVLLQLKKQFRENQASCAAPLG